MPARNLGQPIHRGLRAVVGSGEEKEVQRQPVTGKRVGERADEGLRIVQGRRLNLGKAGVRIHQHRLSGAVAPTGEIHRDRHAGPRQRSLEVGV